jgi:fatty-acyl-CoA synthase
MMYNEMGVEMAVTIDSVLRWWGSEESERFALCLDGDRVNYRELNSWVGRVASRFVAEGLCAGERVAVYAPNSLEWCVVALAAIRAGGILAGINLKMVQTEVAYLLGDYAPVILVTDGEGAQRLQGLGPLESKTGAAVRSPVHLDIGVITALRHGAAEDFRCELDPDAVMAIVTTSGSTARPKGVMYTHRSMIDYNCNFYLEDPIDVPRPKMLVVAPFSVSAGLVQLIQNIVQGGSGYIQAKFDAQQVLHLIRDERINIFCGAPIFLQRVAECPDFAQTDVSCIQIAHTGGAAVPIKMLKTWADKGVLVRQIYGQTECGGNGTVNPRRYALTHPDKCGHGGPLKEIAIIDGEGKFLPAGEQGQIVLRGPGMMRGYWNNPQATGETIVDGWLRTGDLGVIDELGLLKMVDRVKDIVISGGLNISAAEVERVIMEHPGVEEVAVIAAPDEKFGETAFAIIFGKSFAIPSIIEHCNANLSSFKVPRYVCVSEEPLPRLASGKISKPELRKRYLGKTLPERVR